MRLKTRLTQKLAIEHPLLLAPMNVIAGGSLLPPSPMQAGSASSAAVMATPIGSSGNSQQRGMHGSAAGSLPGRWRGIRSCWIRFWPSSRRL